MRKIAIPCVSILLLSMFSNAAYAAGEGSKEEKRQIAATLNYVANLSRDPEAARFRNITTFLGNVCGEVNFKNSQGGYIGFAKFSSKEDREFIAPELTKLSAYVAPFDCIAARKAYDANEAKVKNAKTPAEKAAAAAADEENAIARFRAKWDNLGR